MKTKSVLALSIITVLSGCAAVLKPGNDVSKYYIIPGTTFVATQLCGIDSGVEACLRMQDGATVKSVIKSDFKSWIYTLDQNEQIAAQSGKTGIVLNNETGDALLKALIIDNKKREQIKREKSDDRDDR